MRWTLRADFNAMRTLDRHQDAERRFGRLEAVGDTTSIPIRLQTRGVFRLDPRNCSFPPLRLQVVNDSLDGPRPDWLRRLGNARMTVPCQRADSDMVLLEYVAYRIRNVLGEESFKVRLVVTTFIDESGQDEPFEAWTFIRESNGRFERRLGWTELPDSVRVVDPRVLVPELAALNDAFEYLIGNTDWSIRARHNHRIALDSLGRTVTVPYDFDFAGIVDARYAAPDPQLRGITEVTQRMYRGACRPDEEYAAALATIREHEDEIMGLLDQLPALSARRRVKAKEYLQEFFREARDGDRLVRTFNYSCVPA